MDAHKIAFTVMLMLAPVYWQKRWEPTFLAQPSTRFKSLPGAMFLR